MVLTRKCLIDQIIVHNNINSKTPLVPCTCDKQFAFRLIFHSSVVDVGHRMETLIIFRFCLAKTDNENKLSEV